MSYSISTTYAGESATGYISKALLENKTISGNYITLLPNVKFKMALPTLNSTDNLLQADGCSFNAQGTLNLAERLMTVTDIKSNIETCKTDLETFWTAAKMTAGALNSDVPTDLQTYTIDYLGKKVNDRVEKMLWQGDTAGATSTDLDLMDGFVKTADGASDEIPVTGTTITSSNVVAEVQKVYDAIPSEIIEAPDLKIYVPLAVGRYYKQAIASQSNEAYYVGDKPLDFLGVEVVTVPLAANTIVAARVSNLFVGTDLIDDKNEVRIIDMSETDGSDNIRYKMRFKLGVQIGTTSEVVLYKPAA